MDWVNLNLTMAPINSSLGTEISVNDATLLLEAISCVVTKPSSDSLRKYDSSISLLRGINKGYHFLTFHWLRFSQASGNFDPH